MELRGFSVSTLLLLALITCASACLGQSTMGVLTNGMPDGGSSASPEASGQPLNNEAMTQSKRALGPTLPEDIKLPDSFITNNALTNWGRAHRL